MYDDTDGADLADSVQKALWEILEFRRIKVGDLLRRLGKGWPAGGEVLVDRVGAMLKVNCGNY